MAIEPTPAPPAPADGSGAGTAPVAPAAGQGTTPTPAAAAKAPATPAEESILSGADAPAEGSKKPDGEGKKEGEKPPEPAASDIKVTLPEGITPDEVLMPKFIETAKSLKLDSASAQKMVDLGIEMQQRAAEAATQAFTQQKAEWLASIKADKELGGANLKSTMANARRAVLQFGGQALAKDLHALGVDNHPTLVRAFAAIGKAIGEDTVSGSDAGGAARGGDAALREMYPTMFKE